MSITFTNDELSTLKEMLKGHPELGDKLNNIQPYTVYQSYMGSIEDDVLAIIENKDCGEISDVDLEKIMSRVSNYDSGHYNDFIDTTINNVINGV